jgi:hypothetical protein
LPTRGQAFFYFGPNKRRFTEIFGPLGLISDPRKLDGAAEEPVAEPDNTYRSPHNTFSNTHEKDNTDDGDDNTMRNGDGYPSNENHGPAAFGPSYVYRDAAGRPYLRVTRIVRDGKKKFPQWLKSLSGCPSSLPRR